MVVWVKFSSRCGAEFPTSRTLSSKSRSMPGGPAVFKRRAMETAGIIGCIISRARLNGLGAGRIRKGLEGKKKITKAWGLF